MVKVKREVGLVFLIVLVMFFGILVLVVVVIFIVEVEWNFLDFRFGYMILL